MASASWNGKSRLERIHDIPLKALNLSARRMLGNLLDPPRITFSQTCGVKQDWQGLAELMGLSYDEIRVVETKDGKTYQLLEYWSQKPNSTIGRLLEYLEQMERFDVLEHGILQDRILDDVESYKCYQERLSKPSGLTQKPIQVPEVNTSVIIPTSIDMPNDTEYKNITIGEVRTGKPEYFDAFVCHAAEDVLFVKHLIHVLEEQNGLKLCIKDRDVIPGSAGDTVIAYLIAQRCNKMIIVLSPNFQKCPECDFMVKYGQSLCPGARNKKLVPIIIKQPCVVPDILRFITVVDYTKCALAEWFWTRVTHSLKEMSYINGNTEYGRYYAVEHNLNIQLDSKEMDSHIQETKESENDEDTDMTAEINIVVSEEKDSVASSEPSLPTNASVSSTKPILPQTEGKKSIGFWRIGKKRTHKAPSEQDAAPTSEK